MLYPAPITMRHSYRQFSAPCLAPSHPWLISFSRIYIYILKKVKSKNRKRNRRFALVPGQRRIAFWAKQNFFFEKQKKESYSPTFIYFSIFILNKILYYRQIDFFFAVGCCGKAVGKLWENFFGFLQAPGWNVGIRNPTCRICQKWNPTKFSLIFRELSHFVGL
jgi:hypothetical protein